MEILIKIIIVLLAVVLIVFKKSRGNASREAKLAVAQEKLSSEPSPDLITHEREYDEKGNLVKEIERNNNGSISGKTCKKYDALSNLIVEDYVGQLPSGHKFRCVSKYDSHGKLIDKMHFELKPDYRIEA